MALATPNGTHVAIASHSDLNNISPTEIDSLAEKSAYNEQTNTNTSSNKHGYIVKLEQYFKFKERKTKWSTEIRGGIITFVTMTYILVVNASIVSLTGGPCKKTGDAAFFECMDIVRLDLITATASASAVASFIMGAVANMPVGLSAGMGMNAYFTFTVVGPWFEPGKVRYEMACFAVFIEGIIFLTLAVTGMRTYIAKMIPDQLQAAITCGIGLFLAMIGMQSAQGIGLVVNDGATSVTLGGCGYYNLVCEAGTGLYCGCAPGTVMEGATTWWGIFGFIFILTLMLYNIKGSVLIGILFVAVMSWFRGTHFTYFPHDVDGDSRFDYFKKVVHFHSIEKTAIWQWSFDWKELGSSDLWVALFTFLYVDLLDTTGTLYAMADFAKMLDKNGKFENDKAAFSSDAIGTTFGALLGLSPITSVVESGSGIQEGAKTGVAALIISLCFLLSLFFSPLLSAIPPWSTGPALIIVGALMMRSIIKINWSDLRQSFPAFLSIIIMPFTYSIAYGIIAGLGTHVVINVIDFIVYCCKLLWHHIQMKRGKTETDNKQEVAEFELFDYRKALQIEDDLEEQNEDNLKEQVETLRRQLDAKQQKINELTKALESQNSS